MYSPMARSIESQLDNVKTSQEPQPHITASERGRSRDQSDLSSVIMTGACLSAEFHAVPPEVDQPTGRFSMNQKWRPEQRSSKLPDIMFVKCGDLDGELHTKRLGSGSRGPCILSGGVWLTPNQFECQGGQGYFRYWKRSIRHGTKPLERYIKQGLIKLHSRFCDCHRCSAPIIDAPQRLRLNKGKRRKRPREDKELNGRQGNDCSEGSGSDSQSETENNNDGGRCWRADAEKSRAAGQGATEVVCQGKPTDGTVTGGTQGWLGTKRNRAGMTCVNGHDIAGSRKNRICDDGGRAEDAGNRSPYKPRIQQECQKFLGSRQLLSPPEAFAKSANSVSTTTSSLPYHGWSDESKTFEKSSKSRSEWLPFRARQSCDLQLVASASAAFADLSGTRSLRSQTATATAGGVCDLPTESTPYPPKRLQKYSDSTILEHQPQNVSNGVDSGVSCLTPRGVAIRSRLLDAVRKAGVKGDVTSWSVDDVAAFVHGAGFKFQSSLFRGQQINGEALMRMKERHLLDNLKLKLGTALCLFTLIQGLQWGLAK